MYMCLSLIYLCVCAHVCMLTCVVCVHLWRPRVDAGKLSRTVGLLIHGYRSPNQTYNADMANLIWGSSVSAFGGFHTHLSFA